MVMTGFQNFASTKKSWCKTREITTLCDYVNIPRKKFLSCQDCELCAMDGRNFYIV